MNSSMFKFGYKVEPNLLVQMWIREIFLGSNVPVALVSYRRTNFRQPYLVNQAFEFSRDIRRGYIRLHFNGNLRGFRLFYIECL